MSSAFSTSSVLLAMLREMLTVNRREHLTVYTLASLANLFLTIPQYQAVNEALKLGIHPRGSTGTLVSQFGSTTGLLLDLARDALIFQGILAALIIGVIVSASSQKGWKWYYTATSILIASYNAYHLGGKFLNVLGWIGVLETSGVNITSVYGNLFWSGTVATVCFLISILFLRRSYGKLALIPNRPVS